MKILILNWKDPGDSDAGGAERYVARIAQLWAQSGHEVTVFTPKREQKSTEETKDGVRYVRSGGRHSVFSQGRRYLKRHSQEFDRVLESISTVPFFSHKIVNERAFALYHQTADEIWSLEYRFPVSALGRYILEPRWIRKMAHSQVVAVSASTAQDLADRGLDTVAIVPPGCDPPSLDLTRGPVEDDSGARFLYVGRFVRQKRPGDALEAFRLIRTREPTATLDMIGDGYLRHDMEDRVPGATIHGFVPEEKKTQLFREASLLLLPATHEGWGIVAIEAGAMGIPVVGYDVKGLRDSILDGETGVLCKPSPQAMAEAVLNLMSDPSRRQAMSRAAIAWAAKHTWSNSAHAIMKVLEEEP